MGLLDSIKRDAKKAVSNKGKFIYFKEGQKQRVRFLQDMDDGIEVVFHDSFERSVNVPCQEIYGKSCPYCDDEGLRTRSQYAWSVYNYETKEVQIFMFPMNNCSPLPAIVAMYDNYGTLTDRDYVISVSGKNQNKSFSVVPMDKVKFRNEKAKPYSRSSFLKMLSKAYPCDDLEEDEEEEYKPKKKAKKKPVEEDTYDDDAYDTEEPDYEDLTPKELYKLCRDKGIEVETRKPSKYYIKLLEEYNNAHDEWDDEDDEWEEE